MKNFITYYLKYLGLFLLSWLGMILGSLFLPVLSLIYKIDVTLERKGKQDV